MKWSSRLFPPLAFAIGGALLVWLASFAIQDRYTSTAKFRLDVEPYPVENTISCAYQVTISRAALKGIIERLNLYPEERERLPLEDVIEAMKKDDIELDSSDQPTLSFAYHDRSVAQVVANELAQHMISASQEGYRMDPGRGRLGITQGAGPGEAVSTLAFWRPRRYIARATVAVTDHKASSFDRAAAEKREERLMLDALRRENLARLNANLHLSHDDEPNELLKDLRIERKENIFTVKFTDLDATVAKKAVGQLVNMVIDENAAVPHCAPQAAPVEPLNYGQSVPEKDLFKPDSMNSQSNNLWHRDARTSSTREAEPCHDPSTMKWQGAIDLLEPASLPEMADGPSRPILATFGFFLGLALWATNFKKTAD